MEALREGLTIKEEEAVRAAIRDLATEVVGYFVPALVNEGADGEEGKDPGAAPTASVGEASDSSSAAAVPQQPLAGPSSS